MKKLDLHLARFIEWMNTQGWSHRTVESYHSNVKYFFDYLTSQTSVTALQDVDGKTLHSYQSHLYYTKTKQGKPLALSTQHAKLIAVRSFFRFLHSSDVILFDPSAELKLPKKKKNLPKGVMSQKQVELLLQQPDLSTPLGFRDRTMMEVMYSTAIRNTELRNLTIYNVDTKTMILTIRKGKNAKDRVVPLGEIACDFIREYLQMIRPQLCNNPEQKLLFVSKNAKQITQANLVWIIQKYAKQANLPDFVTPHAFRHSCATHMLKNGANLRYIQQMLGHASVATTQLYTKVETVDLKAIHRKCHPRERLLDD